MLRKLVIAVFFLLGFSPFAKAQCNVENFLDYESSTNGTVATTALLNSSTHGYAANWTITPTSSTSIQFASAANQPLKIPTGVLCGNSTSYPAGAGSLGLNFLGTGILGANEIQSTLPTQLRIPHFHEAEWFCFQFPRTGSINYDIYDVHPVNGNFTAVNVHDIGAPNPYLNMETGDGNGPNTIPINFSTDCSAPSAAWFLLVITLGQSGAEPHSLFVYNTDGNLVGSVSLASSNAGSPANTVYTAGGGVTSTVPVGQNMYVDSWQMADLSVPLGPQLTQPICTATGLTPALVQSAINPCLAGGTIVLPFGSGTWGGTQITVAMTGAGPVTIQGQSVCSGGCAPGSQGIGLAEVDNTIITTSTTANSLAVTGATTASPFRLTGISFNNSGNTGVLSGVVSVTVPHGQTNAARIDHLHVTSSAGSFFIGNGGWGLNDHILGTLNGTLSGHTYSYWILNGDFNSGGFLDWQSPTHLGTAENWIIEDSNFTSQISNIALTDGQYGCKGLIRHNQFNGTPGGQTHGYDSGGFRSCAGIDIDSNHFTSIAAGFSPWNGSRGGYVLFHGNILDGTALWNPIELDYFRSNLTDINGSQWGLVQAGLNWTPSSTAICGGNCPGNVQNPQAPAYQTSHTYAAQAVVNGSGRNFQTVAGGTSGGSAPNFAGVGAIGGTVTDSGGVVWEYVGGSVAAPPGSPGTNAGFLNTDNETQCSSGVNCTRFVDNNGGTWPFRDQPCVIHGQVSGWCYQWGNSGSRFPTGGSLGAPWNSDAPSFVLQLGRDVFNATPAGYTSYTYPDPLQGGGAPPPPTPAVTFSPTSISFGSQSLGVTSPPQTLTINSVGTANLTWLSYSVTNPPSTTFADTHTGTCPVTNSTGLAPGASCTVILTGETNNLGLQSGTFNLPSNASGSPQTVPLSITGTGVPAVTFSQPSVNYNNQNLATSSTVTITVTSSGTANLVMGTPPANITGTNAGDFSLSSPLGACTAAQSLAPASTCTLTVTFVPSALGARVAQLNVFDNASGSPQAISLTGVGVQVAPAAQVFASNQSGCKQAAPLTTTFCFTADGHIYFSTCTPVSCSAFRGYYLVVQGLAQ